MPVSWVGIHAEIGCPPSAVMNLATTMWLNAPLSQHRRCERLLLARVLSLAVPGGGSQGASMRRVMAADVVRHWHVARGGSWSLEEAAGRGSADSWTH
jgi:hypothetical protein